MKTALITGASSGIGFEFAKLLTKEGYALILVSRTPTVVPGATSVTNINKDLSLRGAAQEVFDEVKEKGLSIDLLINNAGIGDNAPFSESNLEKQERMIELNITSLVGLTRLFLPQMIERKSGMILNVASTAAFVPGPYMAVYYATKAFVLSFSEALSEELEKSGVSVTALCPGATQTSFAASAGATKTPLFDRELPSARAVAEIGYRELVQRKRLVIIGLIGRISIFLGRFLSTKLKMRIVARGQKPREKYKN